ncbi:MAG TPA: 50S ribosomal protein L22 [Candidatus Saccharimonadales bacterium]|nr:50S ribosomal protein L22 [Candidatus Saccharimonadales bacterium]
MAETKTINASLKGLRQTPRKVSLVASLVRGRSVADALVILEHTPKRAAKPLAKLIASAEANAKTGHNLDGKSLVIEKLQVTAGPRLKRFRAGAMGRAKPYQKKSSHILLAVTGEVKAKKKPAAQAKEEAK